MGCRLQIVIDKCHPCRYTGVTMKTPYDTFITVRIDRATLAAFREKANKEPGHDSSTVLRQLINAYLLKGLKNVN
jgi:uncharacterized protein (DUF4415 family)